MGFYLLYHAICASGKGMVRGCLSLSLSPCVPEEPKRHIHTSLQPFLLVKTAWQRSWKYTSTQQSNGVLFRTRRRRRTKGAHVPAPVDRDPAKQATGGPAQARVRGQLRAPGDPVGLLPSEEKWSTRITNPNLGSTMRSYRPESRPTKHRMKCKGSQSRS
ncbi:UNVERIFIED_CONTAM: hypothetical protein K2H54_024420 [Gekko kuhli]